MKFAASLVALLILTGSFAVAGEHSSSHGIDSHHDLAPAISQGSWEVGGGFHYSTKSGDLYENDEGDSQTEFTFAPIFGYFIMDRLAIGAEIEYESESQGDESGSVIGFGPRVAYYIPVHLGIGHPFAEVVYLFQSSKHDDGYHESTSDFTAMVLGLGYDVPLNEHVGLFGLLHYDIDTFKPEHGGSVSGNDLGFKLGLQVFLF
jgi:hypothetical protein